MATRTTDTLDEGRVTFREPEPEEQEKSRTQVMDPVCGMDVDPANPSTARLDYDGTTYYFCADSCKETFQRNPERFIAATT